MKNLLFIMVSLTIFNTIFSMNDGNAYDEHAKKYPNIPKVIRDLHIDIVKDLRIPDDVLKRINTVIQLGPEEKNWHRLRIILKLRRKDIGNVIDMPTQDLSNGNLCYLIANDKEMEKDQKLIKTLFHVLHGANNLNSLLPLVCKQQNKELVLVLLCCGADPNWQDDDGNTAMHFALELQNMEIVTPMINAGGVIHIKNKDGLNAEDFMDRAFAKSFNKD
jgi:hypothetical protein